jgi:hypothetical protein
MTENVFSAENVPVDIKKTKQSHSITGSQSAKKLGRVFEVRLILSV